ncbi:MAG: NUDIX domain-containing protein [Akkermansia sp.]
MNTLDVCCALIELPRRTRPSSSGRQKENGAVQRASLRLPGGKVEPGENARHAVIREIREELGCPVFPVRMLTPVRHREPERIIRLILFCAVWNFAPCPGPWNMKTWGSSPAVRWKNCLGACGPPCVKGMAGRTPLKAASLSNSIAPRESSRPCLKRLQKHLGTFPPMRYT